MLKMGRFLGTRITGDILDNRQEHLHAFAIVREAMGWLERTLPLAAHFPAGTVFREDRLPVPPEALREVLLNAVMHRDYSHPSSYTAIAVFDDRMEIRGLGGLPRGITAESLSGTHRSVLRYPLIAEAFHRTGAVEVWGRGTNRVIEACERYGIEPPTFVEDSGFVVVTLRARIRESEHVPRQVEGQPRSTRESISPRGKRIITILHETGPLGSPALLSYLEEPITPRTLQSELRRLRRAGLVVVTGAGRATIYAAAEAEP